MKSPAKTRSRPAAKKASRPPAVRRRKGRASFADNAYHELRARILDNRMLPGEQFTEVEIATLLKMSRTPVREAMLRLAGEGLVEMRPRHGMRIKSISVVDMREIYEVLMALESVAAGLAAAREDQGDYVERMRAAIRKMDEALEHDDRKAWAVADEQFHNLLVEAAGNARIKELVQTFVDQSHRVRMLTLPIRPLPVLSNRDHEAVVEAVAARDPERARALHHDHRRRSGQLLVDLLASHGLIRA
ncbi:GntR family transcriptional regulator [Xanthobacteraceae bacterium Astr-EGSB]|uniref:GntR family transcriptional regulator n=1 Tax=Astrobacterium formosum TaxID=3069710 RepID=UPI0027B4C9D8|nr:GntR family transcriptional regulator [Xanthobacteraceae bacterium Astr-EGSB]